MASADYPGLQNSCSPPPLIIPHPNPRSFLPPLIHPSPPPSNSLLSFLKVPVMSILYSPCSPPHPSPFHRSPNFSVPHCFVLPTPAPLVSCPHCCALCVSSHTSLDKVYKKKIKKKPAASPHLQCLVNPLRSALFVAAWFPVA